MAACLPFSIQATTVGRANRIDTCSSCLSKICMRERSQQDGMCLLDLLLEGQRFKVRCSSLDTIPGFISHLLPFRTSTKIPLLLSHITIPSVFFCVITLLFFTAPSPHSLFCSPFFFYPAGQSIQMLLSPLSHL